MIETQIFEMGKNGGLQPVNRNAFKDLEPGTVIEWGGNRGWGPTRFCILERRESSHGVMYACYNMDETDKNAQLHQTESWSIRAEDDPSVWHSQHMFLLPETVDAETVEQYRQDHIRQARDLEAREAQAKAEADRLEALGRELWPSLIGNCPAVIVANLEEDISDSQTDYFDSRTVSTVILAPSHHKRDLFPEMRKAADLLPETSHLGIGKGRFSPVVEIGQDFRDNGACYYKGQRSPWHRELREDEQGNPIKFTTLKEAEDFIAQKGEAYPISFDGVVIPFLWKIEEESIEHREKYSMGKGYYLGTAWHHGWQVSKQVFYKGGPSRDDYITLARRHDHLVKGKPEASKSPESHMFISRGDGYEVTYERDWTWVKFPSKPTAEVLEILHSNGGRWGKNRQAWYFTRHIEEAEVSAWLGYGEPVPPEPAMVTPSRYALMGDD